MAGDWIKMRTNLDSHPKVIEIAAMLGLPELHVVGCLWKVWAWADSHTINGNAIRVTDVTLDRYTSVTGFANALRKVGWLTGENWCLSLPNFEEHNGETAKKRGETAIRVAKHRNAKSVTSVTQKVLPEKRREEKRRSINNPIVPLMFDRFWIAYPRKVAKGAAERAWDKATKLASAEIIIAAAELFAQSDKGRGEYCPHPATWLNGKCWEDDPAMWTNRTSLNGKVTIREQATKDAVNDWLRSKQQGGGVFEGVGRIGCDPGVSIDAGDS